MKIVEINHQNRANNITHCNWKSKYEGMGAANIKRLQGPGDENTKLKRLLAEVSLENHAMKELIARKGW